MRKSKRSQKTFYTNLLLAHVVCEWMKDVLWKIRKILGWNTVKLSDQITITLIGCNVGEFQHSCWCICLIICHSCGAGELILEAEFLRKLKLDLVHEHMDIYALLNLRVVFILHLNLNVLLSGLSIGYLSLFIYILLNKMDFCTAILMPNLS